MSLVCVPRRQARCTDATDWHARLPKTDLFRALMTWSETGQTPADIIAAKLNGTTVTRTRPLCPCPQVARFSGSGSTDSAASYR